MASVFPDVGTGTTITFHTGFFARIITLDVNISRPKVDITHMGSVGGREYMPGDLTDTSLSLTIQHDTDNDPPILAASVAEAITITFGDLETYASWNGFMHEYNISVQIEEVITATCEVAITGAITF